jgi:DNA-binding response OmpR family regulator
MKRILIVDDDAELCDEIAEMLIDEGHSVDTAHDGSAGINLAAKNRYDLILLDYKLPGPGPRSTIEKMRNSQPNAQILLVSGRPFHHKLLGEEHLASLVNGTVDKPFTAESILDKIKSLG